MDMNEYIQNYWKQYLLIEDDFMKASPYVTLDTDNFKTFSSIYLKIILETGAEIDNVCKEMCGLSGKENINDFAPIILSKHPSIVSQSVLVKDSNICIKPFEGWNCSQPSKSLDFWEKYNKIKHNRIINFKNASLYTSINALAGLYILLMYRMNDLFKSDSNAFSNYPENNKSKLFLLDGWELHFRFSNIKGDYAVYDDSDGGERII